MGGKWTRASILQVAPLRQSRPSYCPEISGGFPIPSPFLPIRNPVWEIMHQFLAEFGVTLAVHSRIPNAAYRVIFVLRSAGESLRLR